MISSYQDIIRKFVSLLPPKVRDWKRIRKAQPWVYKTLKRDKYTCQDCSFKDDTRESLKLVVHHIDESRKTGKLNNDPSNLVTLCKHCHAVRHGQGQK